jgi:CRP/FNR family transcriptional regulator, polysaccharide utilization system transcription regulator
MLNSSCNCLACIKKSPVFRHLNEAELALINDTRYDAKYYAGEIIFKQGTAMTHLMSFTSGMAKVYIEGYNNRNIILKLIGPGEFVVGPGIYTDYKHHFTVRAIEDCSACFIDVQIFNQIINSNPNFANDIYKNTNLNTLNNFQKFVSLTQKQMSGRVADALLYLHHEIYKINPFKMTISRQELADMTALSKESAIRILKQFKDDKIIQIDNDFIEILDLPGLQEVSRVG